MIRCWLAYQAVRRWPFSCYNRVAWPIYLWLMPWAGGWAHYWSEPDDYRRRLDARE